MGRALRIQVRYRIYTALLTPEADDIFRTLLRSPMNSSWREAKIMRESSKDLVNIIRKVLNLTAIKSVIRTREGDTASSERSKVFG